MPSKICPYCSGLLDYSNHFKTWTCLACDYEDDTPIRLKARMKQIEDRNELCYKYNEMLFWMS